MFRGFLSGIFWGAIAVTIVAGFASLLAPLPATVEPQLSAAETTTGSDKEGTGDIGETSEADEAVSEGSSEPVAKPGTDDAAPLADTAPAPQPEPDVPQATMMAPEAGETPDTSTSVSADSPVIASPTAPAPDAPEAPELAPDDSIASNPQQPEAPPVTDSGAFASAPQEEAEETAPAEEAPEPEAKEEVKEAVAPVAEPVAEAAVPEVANPEEDAVPQPEPIEEEADMTPSAEAEEAEAPSEDSLLKPAGDLKANFPQLNTGRLPTTEDTPEAPSAPEPEVQRPFDVNAVPFAAVGGKPLMSIVLIDDGAPEIEPETLKGFPYPLSIAVNTLATDAKDRVATYRSMGFEILAMIDLPAAAVPADVEVALTAHLEVMPEAVAVMEGPGDGLQGSKPLSDQVTAVLNDTGHGLLLFAKGLNTAQKLASREGVPAASVFRDFDSKGQKAVVIRRFLDQAAFKASQEGGVIMVGRLREQTLEALLVWGLQDRASTVALAPVSAVITAKQP